MSHAQDQKPNTFAGGWLERHAERRVDRTWLDAKLTDEASRLLVLVGDSHLVQQREGGIEPAFLPPSILPVAPAASDEAVFLGLYQDRFCFALEVDKDVGERLAATLADTKLAGLRALGASLPGDDAALLAYAHAMLHWHRRHRYCGHCGAPTRGIHGGHQRLCTNPKDGRREFPRLDPAIIVLVERSGNALLGRQSHWPARRYSTIAGFVEPGESLEDAVVREVAEETDIRVGHCRYRSSQPWPFPASLMLGFHAVGQSDTISLNDGELEDARWWSRAALAAALREQTLLLPPPTSIAYQLITEWFDCGAQGHLADLVKLGCRAV